MVWLATNHNGSGADLQLLNQTNCQIQIRIVTLFEYPTVRFKFKSWPYLKTQLPDSNTSRDLIWSTNSQIQTVTLFE